jgi:hypothetical protein
VALVWPAFMRPRTLPTDAVASDSYEVLSSGVNPARMNGDDRETKRGLFVHASGHEAVGLQLRNGVSQMTPLRLVAPGPGGGAASPRTTTPSVRKFTGILPGNPTAHLSAQAPGSALSSQWDSVLGAQPTTVTGAGTVAPGALFHGGGSY